MRTIPKNTILKLPPIELIEIVPQPWQDKLLEKVQIARIWLRMKRGKTHQKSA